MRRSWRAIMAVPHAAFRTWLLSSPKLNRTWNDGANAKAGTIMSKILALALGALVLVAYPSASFAAERLAKAPVIRSIGSAEQTSARYHRQRSTHAPRLAGRRIGFYSYSYRDVIDTYGMSRTLYGGTNTYRAPFMDRQTPSGPFDHGFFFDSGMGLHGGDSPYQH
jgi:hypothetical protein